MRLFLRTKQYPVQLRTTKFWKVLPQYYSVLQSTTPVLHQYYSILQSTTPESTTPVLQSASQVLLRTTKYYSSTTLCYKILVQYYSVLQSTTPVLLRTTKYYSSTTKYYSVCVFVCLCVSQFRRAEVVWNDVWNDVRTTSTCKDYPATMHSTPRLRVATLPAKGTWRIIPGSKWLVTSIYKLLRPFTRGIISFRGLTNHGY